MNYRHEVKVEISASDIITLRQRLCAVMQHDIHAENGVYYIRSLYFDNLADKALKEKLNGVNKREKFRIRYYNGNKSVIRLEKKSKINSLCTKQSAFLTEEQAQRIAAGDTDWMAGCGEELIAELYSKMKFQGLKPMTVVDYTRGAFVYAPGNVRVTLDYNLRTALRCTDFLNPDCVTIPAGDASAILEIKWDEFLPSIIRDITALGGARAGAFSKYAACRIYD